MESLVTRDRNGNTSLNLRNHGFISLFHTSCESKITRRKGPYGENTLHLSLPELRQAENFVDQLLWSLQEPDEVKLSIPQTFLFLKSPRSFTGNVLSISDTVTLVLKVVLTYPFHS